MSELQKEAVTSIGMANRYLKIKAIFDQLDDEFKLLPMMRLAGIKDSPMVRSAVSRVLVQDFRCRNVRGIWKKP